MFHRPEPDRLVRSYQDRLCRDAQLVSAERWLSWRTVNYDESDTQTTHVNVKLRSRAILAIASGVPACEARTLNRSGAKQ
jgi:hypothetical protein